MDLYGAVMAKTNQQILDAVNDAIFQIVSGAAQEKRISIGGEEKIFTALNLDELRRLRTEMKAEISDEENGTFTNAQFLDYGRFS